MTERLTKMDTPDAAQLTDAEAEAVLFALAEPLEWFPIPDMPRAFGAQVRLARYGYCSVSNTAVFRAAYAADVADRKSWVFREYPTPAEAKAACERHHATGKWT